MPSLCFVPFLRQKYLNPNFNFLCILFFNTAYTPKKDLGGKFMNRRLRTLITVILFFSITSLTALAAQNYEEIKVFYRDIRIFVDKNEIKSKEEPFIFKDRVYVPIRFVAESLDLPVLWNSEDNTISISSFQSFEEAKPLEGERFVYGEILSIDREKGTLHIYQHIDDNSVYEESDLKVSEDVIILLQRNDKKMNLGFEDLKIGDIVGMVVNKENKIRGISLD